MAGFKIKKVFGLKDGKWEAVPDTKNMTKAQLRDLCAELEERLATHIEAEHDTASRVVSAINQTRLFGNRIQMLERANNKLVDLLYNTQVEPKELPQPNTYIGEK